MYKNAKSFLGFIILYSTLLDWAEDVWNNVRHKNDGGKYLCAHMPILSLFKIELLGHSESVTGILHL